MSDDRSARTELIRVLYASFDAGPYKRDAFSIADAIAVLIDEKIAAALAGKEGK